jgi:Domain of unknown function (DUF397)
MVWTKSSRSASNGCCVEIATMAGDVAMRDSKNPDGGILRFQQTAWSHFLARVKAGEFDFPTR